jgi:hypothetical protein
MPETGKSALGGSWLNSAHRFGPLAVRPTSRGSAARTDRRRREGLVCLQALVERPFVHPPITGTERPRQIFAASRSATSVCRGTASTAPVFGLVHRE